MDNIQTSDEKEELKVGGYISELTFNNCEVLQIKNNDIVIFVGPNNAGKSQSLNDIYTLCEAKNPTVVISDIKITKSKGDLLIKFLENMSVSKHENGYVNYQGYNFYCNSGIANVFNQNYSYTNVRNAFVSHLSTEQRLSICNPPQSINRDTPKQHPIHYVAFNPEYRMILSANFRKAFGTDITPNTQFGQTIPLCLGEPIILTEKFKDEQERFEEYGKRLSAYKQVHQQGDGIRSFTGILLNLMIDYYCTFLIDEPESFLHPPQANIMGRIIGETLKEDQQAFISTHSQEIIKGLLDVCPDRIKIVRITRDNDTNYFSVLENEKFKDIWNDPLLKHSEIMSSMFHQSVVLCESDSDCKMYSIINSFLKESLGHYSETLFIHCGGKQRMHKIISALKSLNVDVKVVPDIDVLNDETIIKGIVESCGSNWATFKNNYKIICANLYSPKEQLVRTEILNNIKDLLEKQTNNYLSQEEINNIRIMLKTTTKWSELKHNGTTAIPAGDATKAYNELNDAMKKIGIFIVPCGELECFIKEVGGHGPDWVNTVLEIYPDLNNNVYDRLKDFICKWGI
jgi:ABC-type polar amino acid transport system ATPase subunit